MDSKDAGRPTMEVLNVPPIVTTYRQALRTFDGSNKKDFETNMVKLKALVNSLRADDLGFDNLLTSSATWSKAKKAPCTYIEVFQNHVMNMSIFILKPGFKMPLHDHPHMHGLLKVISGSVKITSYTEYPLMQKVDLVKFEHQLKKDSAKGFKRRKLFAKIQDTRICQPSDHSCLLSPQLSNYHEIEALNTPAAFFDVLAPPYDTFVEGVGPRRCRYYEVVGEISTNVVQLQETDVPDCFFCDQAPYLGPILV